MAAGFQVPVPSISSANAVAFRMQSGTETPPR
jgi:hypothetical protein